MEQECFVTGTAANSAGEGCSEHEIESRYILLFVCFSMDSLSIAYVFHELHCCYRLSMVNQVDFL